MKDNKEREWTTLESHRIFERPWLTVRRDRVQLPTGEINPEFYVIEYPDWVNVIAIDEDGMFVMERQFRYGIKETRYEICAGVIEHGETPLEAARRELAEETGYTGGDWTEIMTICGNPSTTNNYTHCFLATGVKRSRQQHLDRTEDIMVELLTRAQLLTLMDNGQILQAMMLAPLWRCVARGII